MILFLKVLTVQWHMNVSNLDVSRKGCCVQMHIYILLLNLLGIKCFKARPNIFLDIFLTFQNFKNMLIKNIYIDIYTYTPKA